MTWTLAAGLPFRPGSVSWKIGREPVGGLMAAPTLLLQITHPLVGAGVSQFSDYQQDPWGRLWRTLDIFGKLAFGTPEASKRQEVLLRRIHERVRGVSEDGVPYDALDPDLQLWVWATLARAPIDIYEMTFGALPDEEPERYYAEQKLLAYASGVPEGHCPPTYADFRAYFDRMVREELRATPAARDLIGFGRRPPMPFGLGAAYGALNHLAAAALLPERLRDELGLPWNRRRARAFAALLRANRLAAKVTPDRVRHWPIDYLVARDRPLRLFQGHTTRSRTTAA